MSETLYLADLLALQILNANVAYYINRSQFDALSDYFIDSARYEEDARKLTGRDKIIEWFSVVASEIAVPVRQTYSGLRIVIVDRVSAGGSSVRVSFLAGKSPQESGETVRVCDVDDVYQIGADGR
jgi:SnoaL-like domain